MYFDFKNPSIMVLISVTYYSNSLSVKKVMFLEVKFFEKH